MPDNRSCAKSIAWDQLNGRIATIPGAWAFWHRQWVASLTPEENYRRLHPVFAVKGK